MASFYAELHVAGYVIPLLRCRYGTHQDTDYRGRPASKVRKSEVEAEAEVPEHNLLEDWGIDPRKRLEAFFVWRDIDNGGAAVETLHLKAAYCTFYGEYFEQSNPHDGSFICRVKLSDPDGWEWYPGGPPTPFLAPASREYP